MNTIAPSITPQYILLSDETKCTPISEKIRSVAQRAMVMIGNAFARFAYYCGFSGQTVKIQKSQVISLESIQGNMSPLGSQFIEHYKNQLSSKEEDVYYTVPLENADLFKSVNNLLNYDFNSDTVNLDSLIGDFAKTLTTDVEQKINPLKEKIKKQLREISSNPSISNIHTPSTFMTTLVNIHSFVTVLLLPILGIIAACIL